jgi:hypothetical protein
VVERPRVGALYTLIVGTLCWHGYLRPGAAVGESGGPLVEKGGQSDMESWHLQGCSPRLCQLRTDGLAPVSKY